jgi:protein-S-isoprenylcysteine O-methyltransferase Ste14
VYFAGLVVEVIVRFPHERARRRVTRTERRDTPAERAVLVGLSLAVFVLPLIYSLTRWLDFADYGLAPRAKARAAGLGAALLAGALWVFWRAHRDLGTNWSPTLEIGAEQTLTTGGIYHTIRHPMYASQLLWGLAQALLLPNWLAGPGGLASFLLLYFLRIPPEERMMLDHFGAAYRAYSARTGRVVPRLRR